MLFGLNASAQVYIESTRQLTVGCVQKGAVVFPNVVIRLDNIACEFGRERYIGKKAIGVPNRKNSNGARNLESME